MAITPDEYGANEGTFNFALAAIAFAFIIYITVKGELSTYIQFFFYTPPSSSGTATAAPTTSAPSTANSIPPTVLGQ